MYLCLLEVFGFYRELQEIAFAVRFKFYRERITMTARYRRWLLHQTSQ